MANKMNPSENQRDELILKLIHADEPQAVPDDLLLSIMEKIDALPARAEGKSYNAPGWLRWGIPGILGVSLLLLLIFGKKPVSKPVVMPDLTTAESFLSKLNEWFAGLFRGLSLPDLTVPDYLIWLGIGSIVLFWGFLGLNHFLNKRLSH